MASVIKKTTGLAGLNVAKYPEHTLRTYYNKILRALYKIPPEAAYRKYTEEIVTNKLQIVVDSKSVDEIEKRINGGQIEELIEQAENELILARKFIVWKPWEPLVSNPPPLQWNWPPTK